MGVRQQVAFFHVRVFIRNASPITISPCHRAIIVTNVRKEEHMTSVLGKLSMVSSLHRFSTHLVGWKKRCTSVWLAVVNKTKSALLHHELVKDSTETAIDVVLSK